MKSLRNSTFVVALGLTTLIGFSCKREQVVFDGEVSSSIDNGFAESEFGAIRNMIDMEARADSNVYGKTSGTTGIYCPGATVTVTITSATTATMVVDFGTGSNCLDGRLRTGKLNASFVGKWKDAGSTVTITPDNYTVAGYAFTFNKVITYNGLNGQSDPYWTVVVTNAVLSHPTNGTSTWSCDRVTTWTEGHADTDPTNNEYEVTGTAEGVSRNGVNYTVVVDASQPLKVLASCPNIVSGVLGLTPQGKLTREIDYGTGACDNQAVLTVGNYTTTITLP